MKQFVKELGEWLRHKIRVIVMKQWKRPKTIYRNLSYLNWKHKNRFSNKEIFKAANSRLGWYKRSGMNVVNFIISKDLLENRIKDGAGRLNPLSYYLVAWILLHVKCLFGNGIYQPPFTLLKPIIKPINTLNYHKIGIMIGLIWSNSTDLNR